MSLYKSLTFHMILENSEMSVTIYSGTSEKGTLWGNGLYVPCREVVPILEVCLFFHCITLIHVCFQYRNELQSWLAMITVSSDSITVAKLHPGPGPGEFLSALVNHVRSTYLNRNSIAVYRIMSCRLSCQCRLSTIFGFFSRQLQQQNLYEPQLRARLSQSRVQSSPCD